MERKEQKEKTNIQPKDNTHQCKNKYRGCNKVVGKIDCNKKNLESIIWKVPNSHLTNRNVYMFKTQHKKKPCI